MGSMDDGGNGLKGGLIVGMVMVVDGEVEWWRFGGIGVLKVRAVAVVGVNGLRTGTDDRQCCWLVDCVMFCLLSSSCGLATGMCGACCEDGWEELEDGLLVGF
ncbi:hypothetical protein CFOL_v3_04675 [Cephalotus follicularis]|uniref:Uncharacterized protein n=1 Tax=Cephalotus follicularis TaxID=3775 RepID=A0A1Q3AZI1_CEPFO|nr:hypothetical protein CFOL_v3_04675 [Cephalotus follicularis]